MFEVPFPHPIPAGPFPSESQKLMAPPAVMYCGWIHDRPITSQLLRGEIVAEAKYQCYLIWYGCTGGVFGRQYYGMGYASGSLAMITERYQYYKSEIDANVPAVKTFIDIRTRWQLLNDCCPPMLYD